jgi:hypothetical protein
MPLRAQREEHPSTVNGSTFLEKVVVPVLESRLPLPEGEAGGDGLSKLVKRSRDQDGTALVHAPWNTTQILCVSFHRRDDHRATVFFDLHAGLFLTNAPTAVLQLGPLLEPTPFNIHFDPELVSGGSISIGCQLHIHPGDTDLVAKRTRQLIQLAYDLDWFTSIYLPECLGIGQQARLQSTFGPDCFGDEDLPDRLESGIRSREDSVDTGALLLLALGLGQWKDILRIIARNSRVSGSQDLCAPSLGARAWQELGRWDRVLTMAREGKIKEGRFPNAPWLSPCYLRALVETGEDIEALRLLGKPEQGEPGFYDLLRGRALHAAGDRSGARTTFQRYLDVWPGDIETRSQVFQLLGDDE